MVLVVLEPLIKVLQVRQVAVLLAAAVAVQAKQVTPMVLVMAATAFLRQSQVRLSPVLVAADRGTVRLATVLLKMVAVVVVAMIQDQHLPQLAMGALLSFVS